MHSFGLIFALKQSYLAETYRIPEFLLHEEKFNRIAVAIITLFTFWRARPRYYLFSIPRKKESQCKRGNHDCFFLLNLCVKWN